MGRLVADVELRTTATGKSVATFRIAVDRGYSKGEDKKADFITIVAWENTADFISKYFHKGDMIALRGEIQTRSYEDSNGNKRTAFEVLAREVSFCGGKNESNNSSVAPTSMSAPDFEEIPDDDEELPF
jgi:single-strand DNA-binding protein